MSARAIDALKSAILLERRGRAFYEKVAGSAADPGVREVFRTMAEEERGHEEALAMHYSSLVREGVLAAVTSLGGTPDTAGLVLTRKTAGGIDAAGYEAAAISAAMALETNAEKYYRDCASAAETDVERNLYEWLADWEHGHLEMLAGMDRNLMESIWFDNGFWPEI
jgi:rubrerythrin